MFVEVQASVLCEGATITGNYAGDQGGGIYAREATWVNSSCDVNSNLAPQGAAIYLTNVKSALFENHDVVNNVASGGSVVYMAGSSIFAKGVTFASSVGLQEYSFNRAIQMDDNTTLDAENCTFDGWLGDAVVLNLNDADGSLILDSCDFRGSSATMAVVSPNSDAHIRNAVVSSQTFANAIDDTDSSGSFTLVDRALDCSDSNACGAGECLNSSLGVLCECLENGECLHGGGKLSLTVETPAAAVTTYPESVSYVLALSADTDGTTHAIWELDFEADDLDLKVFPSSGVLPPGGTVNISVTGTSANQDVGGNLISYFDVTTVGMTSLDSTTDNELEVSSTFYLCNAYEYAMPLDGDDEGTFSCEQCATIDGEEGVDCDSPGATLASLPIREGYWRSSLESLEIRECLHSDACAGATEVSSSDGYCADGYKGPCEFTYRPTAVLPRPTVSL